MVEFETEVREIIQRTHNVKSFRFKRKVDFNFKAGQFLLLTIKIDGKESTKPFSISNSPTEKWYIEITKKLTDSEFSKALARIKIGDWARLKLPYGTFTFDERYKRIAFLAGGIGITPARSICKYIVDERIDADIVLLYGNRSLEEIVFKEDFDVMQKKHPKLKVAHILCEPHKECPARTGLIDAEAVQEEIPDYKDRRFYICGPTAMVEAMKSMLLNELKLREDSVIIEGFRGY